MSSGSQSAVTDVDAIVQKDDAPAAAGGDGGIEALREIRCRRRRYRQNVALRVRRSHQDAATTISTDGMTDAGAQFPGVLQHALAEGRRRPG